VDAWYKLFDERFFSGSDALCLVGGRYVVCSVAEGKPDSADGGFEDYLEA
jgi:hypothetical protein